MSGTSSTGVIGSGPSALYFLKNLLDRLHQMESPPRRISIFEKSHIMGTGMPYSPETTNIHSRSNISSEELPRLPQSFADWLRDQPAATLEELGVEPPVDEEAVYPRLALGRYFQAQHRVLVDRLREAGVEVHEFPGCRISDIRADAGGGVTLVTGEGAEHRLDRVVVATGHHWPNKDKPAAGYYSSPWPIHKLVPEKDGVLNFAIGTLGASLSAFDVVNTLAHLNGSFSRNDDGVLTYAAAPGTEDFRIVMHSAEGLLPHLQFAQEEPMREIYRHVSLDELLALVDAQGYLRLERYFDKVCRPALLRAFQKDGMPEMVDLLSAPNFRLRDFVEKMTDEHDYADAFEGMRQEMEEARISVENDRPVHWKEYMDDLMYTLNFHAELLPAEDHIRLSGEVMPFLMNVVAAMPLESGEVLLALHDAGKLELMEGRVELAEEQPHADSTRIVVSGGRRDAVIDYRMFIDCGGQKPLELSDYPFPSLVRAGDVREARALFADPAEAARVPEKKRDKLCTGEDGRPAYRVGGLDIDPFYRLVRADGMPDSRLHDISFPLTTGLRPYSYGLQACNETARILIEGWMRHG
ncbi:FAD/NAD(P)-binding protein [Luteolibacter sp. SL250]|uniref:FAD/NAD(P)-binding protein n=1 Tax=Luteolibacter sp. SL250 TaxID=2995170 RepID=UPI00227091E0|nr:FAD/NAD(P)-binding protein [Luteolibacter sp. SL250]WAC18762.1 FAD/NAD(P)-binding protein [Luteolibacter sp. SL250]